MRSRFTAFSLIDLLFGCAVMVLLLAVAIPTAGRVRELSKRSACAVNLAGIGAAAQVYAESNDGSWPVPAFRNRSIDMGGINYLLPDNGFDGPGSGQTGFRRREPSSSGTDVVQTGSTEVAVTRAYWMLVRSGEIPLKQFICPSSLDSPDPTGIIDLYYDFFRIRHISYGYQVPFGPPDTRPRKGMDHRQIVAADKGPWYLRQPEPNWGIGAQGSHDDIDLEDPPKLWKSFNSPNHGGTSNGEGQNALFADGHATFARIPAIGIDSDNIYTLMTDDWGILPYNRIHGEYPHKSSEPHYPGQDSLGPNRHSTTDSLIYP